MCLSVGVLPIPQECLRQWQNEAIERTKTDMLFEINRHVSLTCVRQPFRLRVLSVCRTHCRDSPTNKLQDFLLRRNTAVSSGASGLRLLALSSFIDCFIVCVFVLTVVHCMYGCLLRVRS